MESWPAVAVEFEVTRAEVARNLSKVREVVSEAGASAVFMTSSDRYLNEYTPPEDNHRYLLSGFSGSTALMLVPVEGRARLYVDGRYHLQADQEVDPELVEVVKVPFGTTIADAALTDAAAHAVVAYEGDRIAVTLADKLAERVERTIAFDRGEIDAVLGDRPHRPAKPVETIDPEIAGLDVGAKLDRVFADVKEPETTVLVVSALDDVAWLTNARGYHFPYQSSFAGLALATRDEVHVVVSAETLEAGIEPGDSCVHWHASDLEELIASRLFDGFERFLFDPASTTPATVRAVASARPEWRQARGASPVVAVKAVKNPAEIAHLEAINERSSRVVARTIRWVRERLAAGEAVTEFEFYEAANRFYAEAGARDLSFHTIAAVGANSAIIHFSDPSAAVVAQPDDLMLLDSGALYEGGYATDITRTFLAGGGAAAASPEQKRLYTLVLIGCLRGMYATLPDGAPGHFLDALVRAPLYDAGLDYAHGTGHGVGIHVHEPGVGIGPRTTLPIRAGHVSSIEPGLYIEGFGGVRIENVVVFEPHPDHEGFLRARPLTYVGLDEHLVDFDLMEPRDRAHFDAFQEECRRRGTADL